MNGRSLVSRRHLTASKSSVVLFLMSRRQDVVVTSLHAFCSLSLVVMMSRRRFSCRDIILCCCRLHWLLMMSRLQIFCRDITSLIFAPSSAAYVVIPVATCCICSFNYLEVATSQQDCALSKTASMSQLVAFISASTIDCIFIHLLLYFPSFFPSSC